MSNSRFRSHPALFRRHFNPSNKVRSALVFALIALASSLPFVAFAQDDAVVQVNKSRAYAASPNRGAFVLYQGPNGGTLCREATPDEMRAMRNGASDGLRQINHLKNESASVESANGLTIVLRATAQLDANPEAKQAFIAAAAKWEALIKDPITINVDVDFGTNFFGTPFPGADIIGATESPQFFFTGNYPDVRNRLINHASSPSELALANALPAGTVPTDIGSVNTVFVTSPLLRALGALPADVANDTQPIQAPRIGFNSAFGFDFDPSDGITGNRTDFDAVAVHEMGHLLGFSTGVGERELDPSSPLAVTIWDLFRFRPGTADLNNFSTAQRILSSGGEHVQFNGGAELRLSTGKPDGTGGDGNQASHWKDDIQNGGVFIGIMDPGIARNVRETMTANDQSAIDTFGYTITATSAPPNDNFANAQTISGNSGSVNGTNAFATQETGEPTHSPDGVPSGKSIWYRWTAPNSGTVTMTTAGSTYDTLLAAYTGSAVNGLTLLASNDDEDNSVGILTSRVQFPAVGGTIYQIAVDGYGGDQGSVVLKWNLPAVSTVQFASATGTVAENAGGAVISVTRTGDLSTSGSVSYFTSDGTATVFNQDYAPRVGSVDFAPGEASKNIIIPIIDDAQIEGNETFNVGFNGISSRVTIGAPSSTVVTIIDDDAAPPNSVQFAGGSNSALETANATTKVELMVLRTGDTSGPASVNYATSDATASERSDYLASLGTLRFAAGETSKIISVFIVNDSYGESPETFNLTLSNPVGCTLGSATSVVITINSDESVNGPNPVKDASFNSDFFVRQHYLDFLNREPDAGGLAFWKDQIDSCTTQSCREIRRINVSAAFFLSIEFQQTGYLVYKTYQASFDSHEFLKLRDFLPDTQEIGRGVVIGQPGAEVQLEANKVKFFNDFVHRAQFQSFAFYPTTLTAAQFVDKLNANTYAVVGGGGSLTGAQRDALVAQLAPNPASPTLRAQILRQVAENSLFHTRQFNKAFVLMQYLGYLRRNPNDPPEIGLDFSGYNFWLGKLNQFNGNFVDAEMVKAFIISSEYQQRFGP